MHLASRRIDLDNSSFQVSDDQSIAGGLKDTAILFLLLTQLLLGLYLCGDITNDCQSMRLAFVREWSAMYLGIERGAIFAQANWPGLHLVATLNRPDVFCHLSEGVRVGEGSGDRPSSS